MKRFPVHPHSMRDESWFPRTIAWSEAEKFREQAMSNHSQTLERLSERGGLSPDEIYWAYHGMRWNSLMTIDQHMEALALVVTLNKIQDSEPPTASGQGETK